MGRKPRDQVFRANPESTDPTSHVDQDGQCLLPRGRQGRDWLTDMQ